MRTIFHRGGACTVVPGRLNHVSIPVVDWRSLLTSVAMSSIFRCQCARSSDSSQAASRCRSDQRSTA